MVPELQRSETRSDAVASIAPSLSQSPLAASALVGVCTETQITTNTVRQSSPAIHGDVIVWHDDRNGNGDIYAQVCVTDPAAEIDAVITDVDALGPDGTGTLNQGQSGALTRKLGQA